MRQQGLLAQLRVYFVDIFEDLLEVAGLQHLVDLFVVQNRRVENVLVSLALTVLLLLRTQRIS